MNAAPVRYRSIVLLGGGSAVLHAAIYAISRVLAPLHQTDPSHLRALVVLYVAATIALFAAYIRVVTYAAAGRISDPRARRVAIAFPIALNVLLAVTHPQLSIDVLTYLGHGYQAGVGDSPYVQPVKDLAVRPFGQELMRRGWRPVHGVSPYGPLWTWIEIGVARATPNLSAQIWLLKAVALLSALACALMIWKILGYISPPDRLVGTLLYLWNPVVIAEIAGEGHNDAVAIVFVLLSLWFCIRGRAGSSLLMLTATVLTKIAGAIVLPLVAVYTWQTHPDRRRLMRAIGIAAAASAALAVALYAPLWVGSATFDGLRAHGRPSVMPSTPGVLYWYLTRTHSEEASAQLLSVLTLTLFTGYVAVASWFIRDAKTLVRACGGAALLYLVIAPGYWPWYAVLPVTLMALSPRGMFIWWIVALSLCARLAAPIDALRVRELMTWEDEMFLTTMVGIWAPAVVVGIVDMMRAFRIRNSELGIWNS